MLAFAGGIMLGTVCFEMFPESVRGFGYLGTSGAFAAIGAAVFGMLLTGGLSLIVGKSAGKGKAGICSAAGAADVLKTADGEDKRRMLKAGIIMLVAIALHNFPEGMAIGAAGASEVSLGVTVAIVIAVHNVPEGMAIGAPLAGGGMKAAWTVALCALAGGATAVGAVTGVALGGIGETASAVCLAVAGGAMLYVTFADIFAEASALKGKLPSISALAGIVCAAAFVFAR